MARTEQELADARGLMAQTGREVRSIAATIDDGPHDAPAAVHAAADGGMRGAASFLAKRASVGEGRELGPVSEEAPPSKSASARDVATQITQLLKQLVQRFWAEIAAAREQV